MSCPCGHTMQNLGVEGKRIFWCPRCGTLKEYTGEFFRVESPAWIRQVVEVSGIKGGVRGSSQHGAVNATFKVDQLDEELPRVELIVYRAGGQRVL